MKIDLKYPRRIGGKFYAKGQHEISDSLLNDWFVKSLVKDGDLVVMARSEQEQAIQSHKDMKEAKKAIEQPQAEMKSEMIEDEKSSEIKEEEKSEEIKEEKVEEKKSSAKSKKQK